MPQFNLNDYITVDERIDGFWAQYPDGAIRTELSFTNNDGTSVAIRATVHKQAGNALPDATGFAQESQTASGDRGPNRASWWENCETSAIGRALANLGMSISKQRPSRQEMAKVQRVQEDDDGNSASQPAQRKQQAEPPRSQPPRPATAPTAPAASGSRIAYNDPRHTTVYEPQKALREEVAARQADSAPTGWNEVWKFARSMDIQGREQLDAAIKPDVVDDTALWKTLARLKEIKAERAKQSALRPVAAPASYAG